MTEIHATNNQMAFSQIAARDGQHIVTIINLLLTYKSIKIQMNINA